MKSKISNENLVRVYFLILHILVNGISQTEAFLARSVRKPLVSGDSNIDFTGDVTSLTITEGDVGNNVICSYVGSSSLENIAWVKEDIKVPVAESGDVFQIIENTPTGVTARLYFSGAAKSSDSGNYTCQATTSTGTENRDLTVCIIDPDLATKAPSENPTSTRTPIGNTDKVPSPTGSTTTTSGTSSGNNTGLIVGCVIGVLFVIVLVIGIYYYLRRRKNEKALSNSKSPSDKQVLSTNQIEISTGAYEKVAPISNSAAAYEKINLPASTGPYEKITLETERYITPSDDANNYGYASLTREGKHTEQAATDNDTDKGDSLDISNAETESKTDGSKSNYQKLVLDPTRIDANNENEDVYNRLFQSNAIGKETVPEEIQIDLYTIIKPHKKTTKNPDVEQNSGRLENESHQSCDRS